MSRLVSPVIDFAVTQQKVTQVIENRRGAVARQD
jgi:hypothetical protein